MRASEEQLKSWMVAGLDGDAAAYDRLLRELVPLLRQFYRRRLGDGGAVEDLVQDTLIAVHTRRMTFDRSRVFVPWLFAVARHKLIDNFRRARPTCAIDDLENILAEASFEDSAGATIDIEHMLEKLPAKQSFLIRQTRLEGHSVAETARATGYGESDVKISVHRGLKALAARIRGGSK